MKLIQYMQYLKKLHHKYGDVEVKVKVSYETIEDRGFAYSNKYENVIRPRYDKDNKSVVIHKEIVSFD